MTVTRYIRQLAQAQGVELGRYPRRAAFLVLRQPVTLECDQQQMIQKLVEQPELATAIALAQGFTDLVRRQQPEYLDAWLEQAQHSHLAPFVRFAQSLREDYDALKAGVTITTSNGPVEGHINRLKMRASADVRASGHWVIKPPFPVSKLSS